MMRNDETPSPPSRLMNDMRILKENPGTAWEGRRTNKMRERTKVPDRQPVPGLSLVAPVQPSLSTPHTLGRLL